MQFVERITGMFTKPEETIKDILKEPRTEEPLLIVGTLAIISLIAVIVPMLMSGTGGGISIVSAVLSLVFVLIGWPIATGIVHILALFLGGQGKYNPQLLNAIGYTYIVKLIPAIIVLVLLFFMPAVNLGAVPQITAGMSMDQIREAYQPYIAVMEQYYLSPMFILSMVIGYLGLIWSCYLGTIAVRNEDKVSKTVSYIAVFAPMALYIIISVVGTYGSFYLLKMVYG
jgi:hypothetical protein